MKWILVICFLLVDLSELIKSGQESLRSNKFWNKGWVLGEIFDSAVLVQIKDLFFMPTLINCETFKVQTFP